MKRIAVVVLLMLLLAALCPIGSMAQDQSAPVQNPPSVTEPAKVEALPAGYKLQSDDVIRIGVWGEPNLTLEQVVDQKGYINMPLLGQIYAQGLTQQDLIDKLKEGLKKYLVDPKVQIIIVQSRKPKVFVLGQVNRPGLVEFKEGDRVMEAIAQAGSFTNSAYLDGATLTHKGSDQAVPLGLKELFQNGDMSKNIAVLDGDTIYIPEDNTNKYFVLGEVVRQGMYQLKDNVTVVDAVSQAGGPNPRGKLDGTIIVRGDMKNPERIKVNIGKMIKSGDLSQNVVLKAGDIIYIPETSKPDWSKISSVISAIVNSSYLIRLWGL